MGTSTSNNNNNNNRSNIYHADAVDYLPTIPANSVDCIFTSPDPIQTNAEFYKIIEILGMQVKRVLKPTGSLWVHMEDRFNEHGSLMRYPARFTTEMVHEYGWIMRAERIWHLPVGDMGFFNEGKTVDNNRLILDHCYLYHFTNSRHGYYNNFADFQGQPCSIFTERRPLKPGSDKEYEPGFSAELVKQTLLISCPDDGTILDPFCGWGTTGVVAFLMKDKHYKFIGIDIDEERLKTAQERLEKALV